MKQCKCSRVKALERKLDDLESALKIILTWATFEYSDAYVNLKAGHALVPKDVEQLIRRTLENIK